MSRLRSAVSQGQRPTAVLKYEPNPNEGWKKIDYLLQEAFLTMDREICSICNNPVWLCHSTNNSIEFRVMTRTCYAKAEIEQKEKADKNSTLSPGEYLIARPIGTDNNDGTFEPLPSRREAYERMPND